MVVISIKRTSDGDGFLFETTTDTPNDVLIPQLVSVHNMRLQARVVADSVRGLASHGPMKKPDDPASVLEKKANEHEEGEHYNPDPTGLRTGNGPGPKLAETLERVAKDLEDYVDKSQVQRRVALTEAELADKLANVRGAVMMAYPMGLPEWDAVKLSLDSIDGLKGTSVAGEVLNPSTATLWVAGKQFNRGELVSDRLGRNEKTKVIAKLQQHGSGPPGREPAVSEEERKAMMAHYFKRQEQLKRLAESNDDDYLNSSWADPKIMKRSLQNIGDIKAPGV